MWQGLNTDVYVVLSKRIPSMTAPSSQRPMPAAKDGGDEFAAVIAESAGMRHALHMSRRVATTPLRTAVERRSGNRKEARRAMHP